MNSLREHSLLILSLLGAGLALAASLTRTVSERPSRRLLVGLMVFGFLALVAQQLIKTALDAQSAHQRALVDSTRAAIVDEIRGSVHHTESMVEDLQRRLRGRPLEEIGDALVTVESAAAARDAVEILSHGKGSAAQWDAYAQWVASNRVGPGRQLCLTLNIDHQRHYQLELLLAYLVTGPRTASQIRAPLTSGHLEVLRAGAVLERAVLEWDGVDWVLFRDGSGNLFAYAPAQEFAQQILLWQRAGHGPDLERLLNGSREELMRQLERRFPALATSVYRTDTVASAIATMIAQRWSQCLVESPQGLYLVSLARAVRAAA